MIDTRIFGPDAKEEPPELDGWRFRTAIALSIAGPLSLLRYSMPLDLALVLLALGAVAGLLTIPRMVILALLAMLSLLYGVDPIVDRLAPDLATRDWQPFVLYVSAMTVSSLSPNWLRYLLRRLRPRREPAT